MVCTHTQEFLAIRIVTKKIGTRLLAFDDHRTCAICATLGFRRGEERTTLAWISAIEPTRHVDTPTVIWGDEGYPGSEADSCVLTERTRSSSSICHQCLSQTM